ITVSQWTELHRVAESGTPEPGRINLNRIPYQREPMDSFLGDGLEHVVLCWATQTGKTFLLQNLIGYLASIDPCQILVVYPSIDGTTEFSNGKITPMFRETPILSSLLKDNKTKDSGNTIQKKRFKGGGISFVTAGSAKALRAKSCRCIIQDEISSNPINVEGNPVYLADRRA